MTKSEWRRRQGPYCLISDHANQEWHGKKLLRGTLYGWSGKQNFIVRSINTMTIVVDFCEIIKVQDSMLYPAINLATIAKYREVWRRKTISRESDTGKLILEAASKNGWHEEEYASVESQIKSFYNPPITPCYNYTADVRHIPGASRYEQEHGYKKTCIIMSGPAKKESDCSGSKGRAAKHR